MVWFTLPLCFWSKNIASINSNDYIHYSLFYNTWSQIIINWVYQCYDRSWLAPRDLVVLSWPQLCWPSGAGSHWYWVALLVYLCYPSFSRSARLSCSDNFYCFDSPCLKLACVGSFMVRSKLSSHLWEFSLRLTRQLRLKSRMPNIEEHFAKCIHHRLKIGLVC